MKKTLLLTLAMVYLTVLGAGQELSVYDSADSEISPGDDIVIELNTSTKDNYTAELIDSEEDVVASGLEFDLLNDSGEVSENSSYFIYRQNYSLDDEAFVGEWTANAFNSFEQVAETQFSVVSDELRLLDHDTIPSFINEEDEAVVTAEVTNVEEDVDSLALSVENTSIQSKEMGLEASSDSTETYITEIAGLSEGKYSYSIDMQGSEGAETSSTGSFEVFPANRDADDSDVSVGIAGLCGVRTSEFRSPGGGLIALNGSGSFAINFLNNASTRADVNADLSVTYENETRWSPEDGSSELGEPMNMSYPEINKSIDPGQIPNSSVRPFNKTGRLGYYTGLLDVDAECEVSDGVTGTITEYFNYTDYVNFRVATAGGGEGGDGEPVGDEAIPRDANQSGSESDQEVEGDNDNPGETEVEVEVPEPEPVPEPVPEPDPIPQLSLNMEVLNTSISSPRGQYTEILLEVENLAGEDIQNVSIGPRSDLLPGQWDSQAATLGSIEGGEKVNRSVFLRPGTDVEPGMYSVSILANNDRELDLERLEFEVEQEVFEPSISIAEAPESVEIGADSSSSIPFLVRNTGRSSINGTDIEIQNLEACGDVESSDIGEIGVNETRSLNLDVTAGSQLEECETTLIVSAEDGSRSFSRLDIEVVPEDGFVPPELRFPVFASAWTILLVAYSVVMTRFNLDSLQVRLPFLILIAGETAIFLYLSTEMYGLVPRFLLPF